MFERARIGGVIYNLGDLLTRQGSPVDRSVRQLYDPFINIAVADMKKLKLKADQAAIAMVINLTNTLYREGALHKIFDEQYNLFISLLRLYHASYLMIHERPDYFLRAHLLFDQEVFEALRDAPPL